jgi:hypothetical protein
LGDYKAKILCSCRNLDSSSILAKINNRSFTSYTRQTNIEIGIKIQFKKHLEIETSHKIMYNVIDENFKLSETNLVFFNRRVLSV